MRQTDGALFSARLARVTLARMSDAFFVQMNQGALNDVVDRVNVLRNTPRRALVRQVAEETLDHVQPGGAGRGEVHVKRRCRRNHRCTRSWVWVA